MRRLVATRALIPIFLLALILAPAVLTAEEAPQQPEAEQISTPADGEQCVAANGSRINPGESIGGCRCPVGVGTTVIHCWGSGSSCTTANTAFVNNCWQVADGQCFDGACRIEVVNTGACLNCADHPGMCAPGHVKFIDGDAKYRCNLCIEGPCPDPPCPV